MGTRLAAGVEFRRNLTLLNFIETDPIRTVISARTWYQRLPQLRHRRPRHRHRAIGLQLRRYRQPHGQGHWRNELSQYRLSHQQQADPDAGHHRHGDHRA